MTPLDTDFLDIFEAAEVTGLSVHTLRKYAQKRLIPFYQRKQGAPLRFIRTELEAWAEPKRVGPVDDAA